ncbi:MAG: hypothetical protein ACRCT2_05430, partial [Plesiomonas shigelloides]
QVYTDQTMNIFFAFRQNAHIFSKSTGTLVIHTTQTANTYIFAGYFSYANTLLSNLIKAHSNQNDGKCQAFSNYFEI